MNKIVLNLVEILKQNPEFEKLGEKNLFNLYNQKHNLHKVNYEEFLEAYEYVMFGSIQQFNAEIDDYELMERVYN